MPSDVWRWNYILSSSSDCISGRMTAMMVGTIRWQTRVNVDYVLRAGDISFIRSFEAGTFSVILVDFFEFQDLSIRGLDIERNLDVEMRNCHIHSTSINLCRKGEIKSNSYNIGRRWCSSEMLQGSSDVLLTEEYVSWSPSPWYRG